MEVYIFYFNTILIYPILRLILFLLPFWYNIAVEERMNNMYIIASIVKILIMVGVPLLIYYSFRYYLKLHIR